MLAGCARSWKVSCWMPCLSRLAQPSRRSRLTKRPFWGTNRSAMSARRSKLVNQALRSVLIRALQEALHKLIIPHNIPYNLMPILSLIYIIIVFCFSMLLVCGRHYTPNCEFCLYTKCPRRLTILGGWPLCAVCIDKTCRWDCIMYMSCAW